MRSLLVCRGNAPEQIRHRVNGAAAIPDSLAWGYGFRARGQLPAPRNDALLFNVTIIDTNINSCHLY